MGKNEGKGVAVSFLCCCPFNPLFGTALVNQKQNMQDNPDGVWDERWNGEDGGWDLGGAQFKVSGHATDENV